MKKFMLITLLVVVNILCRSTFRKKDPLIPEIKCYWLDSPKEAYILRDSHLEEGPIFNIFDKKFFNDNLLPKGKIFFRNSKTKYTSGKEIGEMIENLLVEIQNKSKKYKDFTVLKKTDFYRKNGTGVIILKFKHIPFVLKLMIETPRGFTRPYNKRFQNASIFAMGGGMSRFLSGFTRIRNLNKAKEALQNNPELYKDLDLPRKWFWAPDNVRNFKIEGKNISNGKLETILPSVYAVVGDHIQKDRRFSIFSKENRRRSIKTCQNLGNFIDPNIQNFLVEDGTNKLVIIDTEYFPALIGLQREMELTSYKTWYIKLAGKFLKDKYFRNKQERQLAQNKNLGKNLSFYAL